MSSQAEVHSIEALKDFRAVLALYSEETLAALGAVDAEVRRTVHWLQQDRPYYWQEQIKRRREAVASAKSEVFRRQLQKKPDYSPSMSEPVENLRRAEASLADAEKRLLNVRKWQTLFNQAVLEYHGSAQRLKDLAASDLPRAVNALVRIIDALEAYLQAASPSGLGPAPVSLGQSSAPVAASAEFETIANQVLDAEPPPQPAPASTAAGADEGRSTEPNESPEAGD
ncbi:MAG: hypothetical protein ACP5XB_13135 [Isosphaeraceae bacterium]